MNTVTYVVNRLPCAAHVAKTPHEVMFGFKPDISNFIVFGSKGFAHVDKSKRTKCEKKAVPCILLGYSEDTTGYRIWSQTAKRLEITPSAKFQERPQSSIVEILHMESSAQLQNSGDSDSEDNILEDSHDDPDVNMEYS